jgi:chromosome segregation ATPase
LGVECGSCQNTETTECPCVKRLLVRNKKNGLLVGKVVTEEGDTVELNFSELLEDEVVKRRLLEGEASQFSSTIETTKLEVSLLNAKQTELESELKLLQQAKDVLEHKSSLLDSRCISLSEDRENLVEELSQARQSVKNMEHAVVSEQSRASALETEINELKNALEVSTLETSSDSDIVARMNTIQMQLAQKTGECERLSTELSHATIRADDSRKTHLSYEEQTKQLLLNSEQTVSALNEKLEESLRREREAGEISQIASDRSTLAVKKLTDEVDGLRVSNEELAKTLLELKTQHEMEIQDLYRLIDDKSANIGKLEASVRSTMNEKKGLAEELTRRKALGKQSQKLAEELLSVSKERDHLQDSLIDTKQTIIDLQNTIDEYGEERGALESRRKIELTTLKNELMHALSDLASKEAASNEIANQLQNALTDRIAFERQANESAATIRALEVSAESLKAKVSSEAMENSRASQTINSLKSELSLTKADLEKSEVERKKSVSHLAALGRSMDKKEQKAKLSASKVQSLEVQVVSMQQELSAVIKDRDCLQLERNQLATRCQELENDSTEAETMRKHLDDLAIKHKIEIAQYSLQVNAMSEQLSEQQSALQVMARERDMLSIRCQEVVAESSRTFTEERLRHQQLAQSHEQYIADREAEHAVLTEELVGVRSSNEVLSRERDELLHRLEKAELRFNDMHTKLDDLSRQYELDVVHGREREAMLAEELSRCKSRIDSLTSDRDKLRSSHQELETNLTQSHNHKESRHKETVCKLKGRITQLEEENRVLAGERNSLPTFNQELQSVRLDLEEALQQRDALAEENEEILFQFGLLKEQMDTSEEQVNHLRAQLDAVHESINCHDGEQAQGVRAIVTENGYLEASLNSATKTNDKRVLGNDQIEALSRQNGVLEAELSSVKDEKDRLEREIKEIRASRADADFSHANDDSSESHVRQLSQERSALTKLVEELEKKIAVLHDNEERNLIELEQRRRQFEDKCQEQDNRIFQLSEQLEAAKIARSQSDNKVGQLQALTVTSTKNDPISQLEGRCRDAETLSDRLTAVQIALSEDQMQSLTAVDGLAESSRAETDLALEDDLRSHVVYLALELERSESKRAEAMSRLLTEREANADSLRQLRESMKRFYASVTYDS